MIRLFTDLPSFIFRKRMHTPPGSIAVVLALMY